MQARAASLNPDSLDYLAAANNPVMWIAVIGIFLVIAAQTAIYYVTAKKTAPAVGMSENDVRTAFRAGGVAAIGPSLAIALIAITFITIFGTPGSLSRIGLIGSAAFEVAGAQIAAGTQGVELGGEGYTQAVFATVLLALSLAGSGWMLVTLIATPFLKRGTASLEKANNPKVAAAMAIIPTAALTGAFMIIGIQQIQRGLAHVLVLTASAVVMALSLWLAKRANQHWLKEWGLGFGVIAGIVVGVIASSAGVQ
ncbi:MAG: DUF5058 family protein [Beutenbergiaceae bacterium]